MAREHRDFTGFDDYLRVQRAERSWSQETAIAELRKLTGVKTTRNWLSQLENGDTPGEDLVRAFERLYGPFTPAKPVVAPSDTASLVAAIRELVEEMRLARKAGHAELAATVAQTVTGALRASGALPRSPKRSASAALPQDQE